MATPTDDIVYVNPDEPIKLAEAASMLAGAREVGGVLVVHSPTGPADAAGIAGHRRRRRHDEGADAGRRHGRDHRGRASPHPGHAGVPVFASPEQAVRGFHHLVQDRRNRAAARELPPRTMLQIAPDQAEVRRAFRRARTAGRGMLTQDEGMAVLAAYGVPMVPSRPAMGAEDAAYAAVSSASRWC